MYILKSQIVDRYYAGSTDDMEDRLELHNSKHARWTKRFQPWVLRYYEEYATRSEAVKRERYVKSLKNVKKFLDMVGGSNSVG